MNNLFNCCKLISSMFCKILDIMLGVGHVMSFIVHDLLHCEASLHTHCSNASSNASVL